MKPKHRGQMSESFLTAVFLSLSGGLQDAYTYLFRGKGFANAQTQNPGSHSHRSMCVCLGSPVPPHQMEPTDGLCNLPANAH